MNSIEILEVYEKVSVITADMLKAARHELGAIGKIRIRL